MTRVEEDDAIKGAVLISAKPGSWIAGANIKMLEALESGAAAEEVAGIGQKGMDRIAALQKKKAELSKKSAEELSKTRGNEEEKTTENPIRGVRVVQSKPAASPAKSDASGSSDDSSTDDEGPRDLLTGSPRQRR